MVTHSQILLRPSFDICVCFVISKRERQTLVQVDSRQLLEYTELSIRCWLVVFYLPSTAKSFRDGAPIYCLMQSFYTVSIGNRTPGRRVAVHYTTAAPRQLHGRIRLVG